MKDIKSLYLTAKSSGKESDINAYIESIQELINDNPNGYISQLEYIISSDIGLKTVKPFIEKNGFPIACYDYMIECLNECIRKCEVYNKDASIYIEAIEEFKEFRSNYLNCFMMFENFRDEIKDNYVKTYYGKNKNGHQNRKLVAGMINTFGEAAIPDLLITAESIDSNTVKTVLEFISNKYNDKYETIYEWVLTACEDISYDESCYEIIEHFEENCLSTKVDNIRNKENQLIRESLIMTNDDLVMEYSENDIKHIQELILFKEYQMTWVDEFTLNEIYDLYEMLDGIIDEDENYIERHTWMLNTHNKKTGEAPTYLSRNHDLTYGEKDPSKNKYDNSDDEASEDEFRRPSASKDDSNSASPLILPSAYNNSDNDNNDSKDDNKDNDSVDKSTSLSSQDKQIINNYYYNYHNSLNRNTNSYNKDNSSRDNHSRIDNSVRDNHSKTDNSTTTNINSYNLKDNIDDIDNVLFDKDEEKKESCEIWKLDPITEAIGDADFNKPESDHPIKDIFTDIDRKTVETQQKVKKKIQDANNVGRSVMKPINRSKAWINKMVMDWKDSNETNIKEKMADPRARKNIFSAIRTAIAAGSYVKAGILLNPVFLFLGVTQKFVKDKNTVRIRNEMIAEIKTEIEILNEKIEDAKGVHDNEEKYKMIRIRNELNKKLIRVGGTKAMSKMI